MHRIYERCRHVTDGRLIEDGHWCLVNADFPDYASAANVAYLLKVAFPEKWLVVSDYEGAGVPPESVKKEFAAKDPTE